MSSIQLKSNARSYAGLALLTYGGFALGVVVCDSWFAGLPAMHIGVAIWLWLDERRP